MQPEYTPGVYDLDALDAESAADLWTTLDEWVFWLRETYELSTMIRACWYRHPALVRELIAAFADWRASYDAEAPPSAPAAWHNYTFRPFVGRLASITDTDSCSANECRFEPHRPVRDADGFAAFMAADLADRPEPTETPEADPAEHLPDAIDAEAMIDLADTGEATLDDPDDPNSAATYLDRRWHLDGTTYRPSP